MTTRPKMLSATFVRTVNVPGRYGDGRGGLGLSLLVKPASRGGFSKSWSQAVRLEGKPTSIGLGRYPVVTLAMARDRALENARAIALGDDPRRSAGRGIPTFADAAETVIAMHAGNWKPGSRSEEQWRRGNLVFCSPGGRPLSTTALAKLLRKLAIDAVPHGFRSSFRDWAAECTDAPREVCELALAHVNSDRVEAAYRRTDLFEKRRVLMADWADYVAASGH